MGDFFRELKNFFRKGDMVLLLLCLVTTAYGCLIIASTTNYMGSGRYLMVQIGATAIGVLMYAITSSIDVDFIMEHRWFLVVGNLFLLALLATPFGAEIGGNRSWLSFPFLPFNIQPAEICKITYILIMASVMAAHQNRISSIPSVMHMVLHLGLLAGVNVYLSSDVGVSLIFVFIFIGMAFAGGVSLIWFALAGGSIALALPIVWPYVPEYQRQRIEVLYNPDLDPSGQGIRYDTVRSLRSLTGGGMTGQGLFHGTRTSIGALSAQHTDYIFSAIGEELGYVGCVFTILLLALIILRCIQVGKRSSEYPRRLICFGAASALIFQLISNVGMCIGVTPVIGLTLPFISYGGSSIVTLYAMLGLVSGVHARPEAESHQLYIRPY